MYILEVGSTPGASNLVMTAWPCRACGAEHAEGRYFVRVRTAIAGAVSNPSNEITLTVGCSGAPAAPTGMSSQVSGNSLSLGWQASVGATGYVLEAGSAVGGLDVASAPVGTRPAW